MKAPTIKSWDSDHDPLEEWEPEDRARVDFWINLAIGIDGEKGADLFEIRIVTEALLSQIEEKKYLLPIPYYQSWSQVKEILDSKVSECKDINWRGISSQLSKSFYWEYQDYKV